MSLYTSTTYLKVPSVLSLYHKRLSGREGMLNTPFKGIGSCHIKSQYKQAKKYVEMNA